MLLPSVSGPYAQADEFGSRSINPMEPYQNQVTRAQGAFSLRMFHRSWGIMMIEANISARQEVEKEFGTSARVSARVGGPLLLWTAQRKERRLVAGQTHKPPAFLEWSNWVKAKA